MTIVPRRRIIVQTYDIRDVRFVRLTDILLALDDLADDIRASDLHEVVRGAGAEALEDARATFAELGARD